jgi:hypothetical protein
LLYRITQEFVIPYCITEEMLIAVSHNTGVGDSVLFNKGNVDCCIA